MMTYNIDAMQQSTQLLFSTVRLRVWDARGLEGIGTGFFFDCDHGGERQTYLVTNRHVVEGAIRAEIAFHLAVNVQLHSFGQTAKKVIQYSSFESLWFPHPDPAIDICVVPVSALKRASSGCLDALFYRQMGSHGIRSNEELGRFPAITNVAMIGYPIGLWDEANNLPIIRRGSTATHPAVDYNDLPEVLVDIACFPGSSGSPVVFYSPRDLGTSSHYFLGILCAGHVQEVTGEIVARPVPISSKAEVRSEMMIHLGIVIKGREVVRAIEALETQHGC